MSIFCDEFGLSRTCSTIAFHHFVLVSSFEGNATVKNSLVEPAPYFRAEKETARGFDLSFIGSSYTNT